MSAIRWACRAHVSIGASQSCSSAPCCASQSTRRERLLGPDARGGERGLDLGARRELERKQVVEEPLREHDGAAAVLHGFKSGLRGLFRSGPWTVYIWILLISMVFGSVRGCMGMLENQQRQERYEEQPSGE